jgi:hypothetical protein
MGASFGSKKKKKVRKRKRMEEMPNLLTDQSLYWARIITKKTFACALSRTSSYKDS